MIELIAAATAAGTSDAFVMSGQGKIIADGLSVDEYVELLEELPGGTYAKVINERGLGVLLTVQQPSQIFTGYGNYKVTKTETVELVAVGLEN